MNSRVQTKPGERGVALVVALLFLLVVTILSVTAARNSSLSLRMSGNQQDMYSSQQSAEAVLFGLFSLGRANDPNDPFAANAIFSLDGGVTRPLAALGSGSLVKKIREADNIAVARVTPDKPSSDVDGGACRRAREDSEKGADSYGVKSCRYYRIYVEHDDPSRSRTRMTMGVVKELPSDSSG